MNLTVLLILPSISHTSDYLESHLLSAHAPPHAEDSIGSEIISNDLNTGTEATLCAEADALPRDTIPIATGELVADTGYSISRPTSDFPNIFAVVTDRSFRRRYAYGHLDVLNPAHSDFVPLKEKIFFEGKVNPLIEETRKKSISFKIRTSLKERSTSTGFMYNMYSTDSRTSQPQADTYRSESTKQEALWTWAQYLWNCLQLVATINMLIMLVVFFFLYKS